MERRCNAQGTLAVCKLRFSLSLSYCEFSYGIRLGSRAGLGWLFDATWCDLYFYLGRGRSLEGVYGLIHFFLCAKALFLRSISLIKNCFSARNVTMSVSIRKKLLLF